MTEINKQKLMKSKLSISEFRNKLKNSTKIGHPQLKIFSPFSLFFYDSSKPFYGLYDESTFSLTSNLGFTQNSYKVKGSYKVINGKLQIQYKMFPKFKYQYYFWIFWLICGFAMLVFINIGMLSNDKGSDLLVINPFFIFMLCFGFFTTVRAKRKLEKKFIEIFEICS